MPRPKLWVEVDGKLREPTIEDVRQWLWDGNHCLIITQELALAQVTVAKDFERLLGPEVTYKLRRGDTR
jgi:hypothetical protein